VRALSALRTLRGRLLAMLALAVCCFVGALAYNDVQMRRIGASLQVVDTTYLPLVRLSARMGTQARPGDPSLAGSLTEARTVARGAASLPLDDEEHAAVQAILRQLEEIQEATGSGVEAQQRVLAELAQLAQLLDARIAAVAERTAQAHQRAARMGSALLAISLLAGAALLWITHVSLLPIGALTEQARRRAEGEAPAPLRLAGTDEVATLAGAFERMAHAVDTRDRELRSLTMYLRRILDTLGAAVAVAEDARVTLVNPAATALWGFREGDALPPPLADLTPGRHAEITAGSLRERVHDVVVAPFGDTGRLLVGEDVTARRDARERLERSERLALVGQLLAQVTHEVRNPLNAMSLHAELLAEEPLPDEARPLLATIVTEIRRLEDVTQRYLDLARRRSPGAPDLGRARDAVVSPEDPVALARGVVALEEEALRRVGVHIAVSGPEGHRCDVDGNALRRALHNLVRNAAEAGARAVTIEVTVAPDPLAALVYRVADDGPGMESEVAARVFEPFFSTRARGTGLGLAITRQDVEDLGGTVRCDSAPGRGAVFTLAVPL
jgi:signal transduction histidine kinase